MTDSILTSVKKMIGLDDAYTVFDLDIMTHINATFDTLRQLGVGPYDGFMVEDATALWEDYFLLADRQLNSVKQLVYMKVRLAFDPPQTAHHMTALKEQIQELEWRLNVTVDTREDLVVLEPSDTILDGGVI